MKWKTEVKPVVGALKEVTKFLLFPKCIDGECRWWEKVTYTKVYTSDYFEMSGATYRKYYWRDFHWGNKVG